MALVVPTGLDRSVELEIPIPNRPSILVTVPKLNFMSPKQVRTYNTWTQKVIERAQAWDDWVALTKDWDESVAPKPEPPCKVDEVVVELREFQLRWLEQFVSKADFRAILDHVSAGAAQWIFDQIKSDDDSEAISVGESAASDDS